MVMCAAQASALTQECPLKGTQVPGTPEELISSYFVRETTHQHVHPMANAPFEFVMQVSHTSTESGYFGHRDLLNLILFNR